MLKRIPRRDHITPVLRELHWLRIHDRIILKIYLCDSIRLNVKSTTIRTRASFDLCLLCVPPISVLIHSLVYLLCMLLQHCGMPLI